MAPLPATALFYGEMCVNEVAVLLCSALASLLFLSPAPSFLTSSPPPPHPTVVCNHFAAIASPLAPRRVCHRVWGAQLLMPMGQVVTKGGGYLRWAGPNL